jgi:aspartyl-tRNA synthetase
MKTLEELMNYLLENIRSLGKREFELLNYTPPSPPGEIPIITYDEAIDILLNSSYEIRWGDDLDTGALRIISSKIGDFYFIIEWPWENKTFYIRSKAEKITESFDLMYRDIELSSGGTREHIRKELENNLIEKGLDPKVFEFHTKFYDYGMPPHAGFGLGLDRLMLLITGRENIREVVLYPRDPERLEP